MVWFVKRQGIFLRKKTYDLIETAASHIAEGLLVEYKNFRGVKVFLKKPWAPIMMNLDTV
jgi:dihydroneopterin aldolase/2-amino-4-hydroxy-6-hydroxymethyldihydropteridine diphosphokinase